MPHIHVHRMIAGQVAALSGHDEQTPSLITVYDDDLVVVAELVGIEPSWEDNKIGASCIPNGRYTYRANLSPRFGKTLLVEGTGTRSLILLHAGNFREDTRGCLIVGMDFVDLDGDRMIDVRDSRPAIALLLRHAGPAGTITYTADAPTHVSQ